MNTPQQQPKEERCTVAHSSRVWATVPRESRIQEHKSSSHCIHSQEGQGEEHKSMK